MDHLPVQQTLEQRWQGPEGVTKRMTAWLYQALAVELAWHCKQWISRFSTRCGSPGVDADPNDVTEVDYRFLSGRQWGQGRESEISDADFERDCNSFLVQNWRADAALRLQSTDAQSADL
jgi:hypothetical protein